MSEAVAVAVTPESSAPPPAATDAPAVPEGGHAEAKAEEAKQSSYKERRAKALSFFKGESKPGAAPAEAPKVESTEAKPAESAEKAPEAPAEAKTEPPKDAKELARSAKLEVELRQRDSELAKLRKQAQETEAKAAERDKAQSDALAKVQAQLDRMLKDPVAALKAHGGADAVVKRMIAGEIKPPTAEELAAETLSEQVTPLKQQLAEMQAKLDAAERAKAEQAEAERVQSVRTSDLGVVKTFVDSSSDKYPLCAAFPGAHELVLQRCYENSSQDIDGQTAQLEQFFEKQLAAVMTSPKALARLAKADPKVRETISTLVKPAADQGKKAAGDGGPRVSAARDAVSAPTNPVEKPKTERERKARAIAVLFGKGE
jgi:hypothetical protein